MARPRCTFRKENGLPCGAPALLEDQFCFWHSPDHATEAADARRLGGLRRKREGTIAGAYQVDSLDSLQGVRRLVDIAVLDALGLDNSVARVRILLYAAQVATKLLEVGELEERLQALESFNRRRGSD